MHCMLCVRIYIYIYIHACCVRACAYIYITANGKKKKIVDADMHADHLTSMDKFKKAKGHSATVLQNQRHQQKQFEISESNYGRSAGLVSKSSRRKLKKIVKANTKRCKKPDNKCQDDARTRSLCPLNTYATACVRCVEREGERKDVPAPVAKANPVGHNDMHVTQT